MVQSAGNPIAPFLARQGTFIIDGGLATELEARGYDLNDPLWSARILLEAPGAIRQLHLDYLLAGADCVITASYQASVPGFMRRGLDRAQATALLRLSVQLALEARQQFWAEEANRVGRLYPLVAASVGPYGAYLADGSEYRGDYTADAATVQAFHRERWAILAESGADLLACETIPSYSEAKGLLALLRQTPQTWAWLSFSCRNGQEISDGTPLTQAVALCQDEPQVVAVGINCTAPRYIPSLVAAARQSTGKPILVYPNSGESYDARTKKWQGENDPEQFAGQCLAWHRAGARLIGGCCRTGPDHIRQMRRALEGA